MVEANLSSTDVVADPLDSPSNVAGPRTAKACAACSRQKLKCDGCRPCSRCATGGGSVLCEYFPSMRGKIKKRKTRPSDTGDRREEEIPATKTGTHRPTWERPNSYAGTSTMNSTLWNSTSVGANPLIRGESVVPRMTRQKANAMDKLTSTLPLPGDSHNPLSVMVELAEGELSAAVEGIGGQLSAVGNAAEEQYYAPLERTLKEEAPHIMSLINAYEAETLFDTYFKYLHPHLPVLDKDNSSPGTIARRSNFLFNAICCAAARSHNVVLWERLKVFARSEMERLPIEKNMDVVQGHLIYTWWNLIPSKRFEQDQTWLRAGLACRTAIDIALHRVAILSAAQQGLPAPLLKTIVRTWLMCFIIDRTLSIQLGKPNGRQWEMEARRYVEILRGPGSNSEGMKSGNAGDDAFVAALTDWALIMSCAVDAFRTEVLHTSGSDSQGFSSNLSTIFADQLHRWREASVTCWRATCITPAPAGGDQFEVFEQYARLVVQSLELQNTISSCPQSLPSCFIQYQSCAVRLIETIELSGRSIRALRGAPDFAHTALTYAATSLLRCSQSRFFHLSPDRRRLFGFARKAADLLAEAAVGPDHIAAIQSAFISKLIAAREINQLPIVSGDGPSGPLVASPFTAMERTIQAADFESFARALGVDQSMTQWPPVLPGFDNGVSVPNWESLFSAPGSRARSEVGFSGDNTEPQIGQAPLGGLGAWAAQQDLGISSLGPGVGGFFGSEDMSFMDGTAWQSLFQGIPDNNMQR